jgi:hypothetical protein
MRTAPRADFKNELQHVHAPRGGSKLQEHACKRITEQIFEPGIKLSSAVDGTFRTHTKKFIIFGWRRSQTTDPLSRTKTP